MDGDGVLVGPQHALHIILAEHSHKLFYREGSILQYPGTLSIEGVPGVYDVPVLGEAA